MKQEQAKKVQRIIAKAWADEGFKKRLISNPDVTLKGEGIEIPKGIQFRIVENTDEVFHLVLPVKPAKAELSDEQLDRVAAGGDDWCSMTTI